MSMNEYILNLSGMIPLFVIFYINYFFLAPKFFMVKGKRPQFFLINAVMIVALAIGSHLWFSYYRQNLDPDRTEKTAKKARRRGPSVLTFIIRDMLNLSLTTATATAIVMTKGWNRLETERQEAENARVEAELKNLRSQINPHFLLNTLNNIYALTAFDSDKAQGAILELSQLLRHVLYDNQQPFVPINDEVQFIQNYVKLMKIRMPANVQVNENIDIPEGSQTVITPLLFISLIENAFKHGISPSQQSFININISDDNGKVTCCIENSNFPKADNDRSGHGIGLEQVQKRLDLAYPGKYSWEKNVKDDVYQSKIIIDTTTKA